MAGRKLAQFVISIDLEMSWGSIHHGKPHDPTPYVQERDMVADVLAAMAKHGIAATWAVVGHLFLDHCSPHLGRAHGDIIRPDYGWLDMDWYELDPCGDVTSHPTWYGPDMIEAIRRCSTPQEIGSHSFGHVIAGDPGCSEAAFESDLVAAKAVAESAGVELRSFVFPRNSIGHLHVLERHGLIAYRGPSPAQFAQRPNWQRRLLRAADVVRPLDTATVHPVIHGGLVDVPQTYLFDPGSAKAERLGTRLWTWLALRRLRHAVRTGSLFHMWFHTHNLAQERNRARYAMDRLFAEARGHIDRGRLENLTMGEVAARLHTVGS